jgi:bifunctional non-homologous end joining protein LigD
MGLQTYHRKRQFDVTSEPRGKLGAKKGNRYLIQKHAASRLHYDLRLEMDGVLKSWAVTRGPSLNPADKRLAVHVEDHPVEYGDFEGTIPKGQYGGGTVMLWDRGTWTPEGDPHKGYKKGHLSFHLDGEKLHGLWHLVRLRGKPGDKHEPWLLIKSHDEYARDKGDADILEEAKLSVATGRDLDEIAEGKSRVWDSNASIADNTKPSAKRPVKAKTSAAKKVASQPAAKAKTAAGTKKAASPRRAVARTPRKAKAAKTKSAKAKKAKSKGSARLPDFIPPMLATLRTHAPADAGWLHEIKFDGYRLQARLENGEVKLLTRKGLDWTHRFSNIAEAVAGLDADTALIDGELVSQEDGGISNFGDLQADLSAGRLDRFIYYAFDLMHLDGRDLTALPLEARKAELETLVPPSDDSRAKVRFSEHFEDEGSLVLKQACRLDLEGIISKRRDGTYRSGRSDGWIKSKCKGRQELVVTGFADSTVNPRAVGALIAGYYQDGKLTYGGRVGTGYTQQTGRELWKRLKPLEIDKPPFEKMPTQERRRPVHWVKPTTVIEADFQTWTHEGLVRQASFKGVREDKSAKEVVRERNATVPKSGEADVSTKQEMADMAKPAKTKVKAAAKKPATKAASKPATKAATKPAKGTTEIAGVRFTHPDRVYWEDAEVTKQMLGEYYQSVWDWMAPHVLRRPLALVRCPSGAGTQCFFQKHVSMGLDDERLLRVPDADSDDKDSIAIDNLEGLLALVQAGVLEIHAWGCRIEDIESCDRIVFDLDPGEGVAWPQMVAAAREIRERLDALGLESFVKLSGGKGLHVVLPIDGSDWDTTKDFAHAMALAMEADSPKLYVSKMTKSLRKGKIFVDYLRNGRGATAIVAFSTRARPGAAVSVPVAWEEIGRIKSADQYNVENIAKRLKGLKTDPWRDIGKVRQNLPDLKALKK